jgi:CubicO group peptidase (beta-lactamase class C family)
MRERLQERLQELLDDLVAAGEERGVQAAVYVGGERAASVWAGVADARTGSLVAENTLFPVFSTTKGVAATVLHRLAERGRVRYDDPVAEHWPEFAAGGKAGVTVRQALNHSAGVPQVPAGLGLYGISDWDAACRAVAALEPLWEPGTRIQYHAVTFGWIVGEVARRAAAPDYPGGAPPPFPRLLEDEVLRPLGLAGLMYVGVPDDAEWKAVTPRVAFLEEPGAPPPSPDDGVPSPIPAWLWPLHDWMNREEARRACLPASSGLMTAHAIARHYAALLPGGVGGTELLSPGRVRLATEPQAPDRPADDVYPRDWGLGYNVGGAEGHLFGGRAAFGHGGYGGSFGFADPEHKLAVGFTRNRFSPNGTPQRVADFIREIVREEAGRSRAGQP